MSDYGLDAPGVVRNLALVSAAGLILAVLIGLGIIPARVVWHIRPGADLGIGLLGLGLGPGLGCGAVAVAMMWSSRVGKREIESACWMPCRGPVTKPLSTWAAAAG